MATKSENHCPSEGTSKGIHDLVSTDNEDVDTKMNGYDDEIDTKSVSASISHELIESHSCKNGQQQLDQTLAASLRSRSTRACAIKAAERIKLKESAPIIDGFPSHSSGYTSGEEDVNQVQDCPKPPKIQRRASQYSLDQMNGRFGIKVDGDDVILMTSESECSSLDGDESEQIKKCYEKVLVKESEGEDQRRQNEVLVKKLDTELRTEEAKLIMLKKIMLSQKLSFKQLQEANIRKMTANISQNGSGSAYKPPLAFPNNRTASTSSVGQNKGTVSNVTSNNFRSASTASQPLLNLTPQQQQLLQTAAKSGLLNSVAAQAILQQVHQVQMNGGGRSNSQRNSTSASYGQQQLQSRSTASSNVPSARESVAQKIATAKLTLHRQIEQQLLQIPPPQPTPVDLHFIPNANQPDFCSLLGLDILVQRLLKDKNAIRRVSEEPYVCEECGTDYASVWRAIGTDNDSLHLYCEACVKTAQKKKMRMDYTTVLKKAFNKIAEQEQKMERQIAEGKFESSGTPSGSQTCAMEVAVPAVSKVQASTSTSSGTSKPVSSTAQVHSHLSHPSRQSGNQKRSSSGMSSVSSSMAHNTSASVALAAASSATNSASVLLHQQMAAAVALRQANPMLAAMMANPLLNAPNMLQMSWGPLLQQRYPNIAMAALAQAVQSAQQGSNTSAVNSNSVAVASAVAAASMTPLTALAASMGPAAMFNSPQMMRQFQQAQHAIHRNLLLEIAKNQSKK